MMNETVKTLRSQIHKLSPADRIALIEDAIDSLDRTDHEIDRLWAAEARDRLAAFRRGELASRELNAVIAKYRL